VNGNLVAWERSFYNKGVIVDPGDIGAVGKWESEQAFASDGLNDARIFPGKE
jgi:hypothetical protein